MRSGRVRAESLDVPPDELPTIDDAPTSCATTPTRPRRRRARGARSRRGARRNQGPPLQAPDDDPGDAPAVLAAGADRSRAPRRRASSSAAATGSSCTRPGTPSTTCACGIPSRARCSPATTCSRRSRRTSSGVRKADSLKSYLATLDLVGAARRREARAARARSSVRRRARSGRGDQGAPRRAHGAAARGRARARPGRRSSSCRTSCSRSGTGARWPRARRSPTSSTSRTPAMAERWEEKRHARATAIGSRVIGVAS